MLCVFGDLALVRWSWGKGHGWANRRGTLQWSVPLGSLNFIPACPHPSTLSASFPPVSVDCCLGGLSCLSSSHQAPSPHLFVPSAAVSAAASWEHLPLGCDTLQQGTALGGRGGGCVSCPRLCLVSSGNTRRLVFWKGVFLLILSCRHMLHLANSMSALLP